MKVIIADDSLLIQERLIDIISQLDNTEILGVYSNGNDTLEGLRIHKPNIAIVDFNMPGINGLEVLNKIRIEDKLLVFIILTFFSSNYYKTLAIQSGANYFFSKVDEFEDLTILLKKLIGEENKMIIGRNSKNTNE
ncbi:MAG: response regulator transcription factor [Bacteroidales bacterium]